MEKKGKRTPGWIVWFVGLPGAGKSTYAKAVYKALLNKGENVQYLSMDERRKNYSRSPQYTQEERNKAYKLFVEEAIQLAREGSNVIMDGTAQKLSMREYARQLIPCFAEIFIRCPLETAISRESIRSEGLIMTDLYKKALNRKQTGTYYKGLGEVVGIDIPFEENPLAECVIDSDQICIEEGLDRILHFLSTWQN